jgi:hypothetical protein
MAGYLSEASRVVSSIIVVFFALAPGALGKSFLVSRPDHRASGTTSARDLDRDVRLAMGEALGCGGSAGHEDLSAIQQQLLPLWRTMPLNVNGRVEQSLLRYMVHRYFMQRSSLSIHGFEPSRPANASGWGADDIISQRVPAFVEGVLEGEYMAKGFTLEDVATMIATLEQLIFDSETTVLAAVYRRERRSVQKDLSSQQLHRVLERYMVRWLVGGEDEELEQDPNLREEQLPHWQEVSAFVQGQIQSFEFARWRKLSPQSSVFALSGPAAPQPPQSAGKAAAALSRRFSFDDAHAVVGDITKSFGPYWETVCQDMKATLVGMDKDGTGRVRLADFYGSALDTEWRFGESEKYLRQLGALDESSRWHGKRVIIPNYLQATSNCIVSSRHYSVCCANECEGILGEIERTTRRPVASPEEILGVVGNMSSPSELDEQVVVSRALQAQLRQLAGAMGGSVPLHGRLFAQWLHYVFPRECPFPHKVGSVVQLKPTDFGEDFVATREEMGKHAHGVENATAAWEAKMAPPEDDHHMSQWSHEEELLADYSAHMRAPWEVRPGLAGAVGIAICAAVVWAGLSAGRGKRGQADGVPADKVHFV